MAEERKRRGRFNYDVGLHGITIERNDISVYPYRQILLSPREAEEMKNQLELALEAVRKRDLAKLSRDWHGPEAVVGEEKGG